MKKIIFFSILLITSFAFVENDYVTLDCVLHVHTNFSSGKDTIEKIVELAETHNIDCVVLTDHLVKKIEFGIWPFRKIIKRSVNLASVKKFGVENYLSKIKQINRRQNDVIVIAGVEVTPHYFWSVEEDSLVVNNLHKHMLVIGVPQEDLFNSLAVLGNELTAGKFKIFSLWPIIILLLGIFLRSKFLIISSLILLAINFPFKYLPFDQYKNYFELPYQNLINFINSKSTNSLIIWAHPEATNYEKKVLLKKVKNLKIYARTLSYHESLLNTYDYNGFSIFAEGYRKIGCLEGIWDEILIDYILGKRKKPVWCFSELDYGEFSEDEIHIRKNVVYVKQKDYETILFALKNGNFYSLWRDKDKELVIEDFKFCGEKILFGQTYNKNVDKINISFKIKFSNDENLLTKVFIIKNGKVVFTKEITTPATVFYEEEKPKMKSYYRIFIESKYPNMVATNPIFVE